MEERKSLFYYAGQIFSTFGLIIFIFVILKLAIGDSAAGKSLLFEYGSKGFAVSSLLQLFLLSFIISISKSVFFDDGFIKNMSMLLRTGIFFTIVIVATVAEILIFEWFPANDVSSWLGFVLSFFLCTSLGIAISVAKEKSENKKMEEALNKIKEK